MKTKVYNKPFGRDGLPRIWFGHCSCSRYPNRYNKTELNIHLFKKLFLIDLGMCKDCDAPF